ncbi:ABC transporter permease subunit [Thermosipho atlanticus]|uniref:Carbohydrate ABC transporter membrane protein 2, CUT1 family n=1 Tax=Thermosipho atlanticus DSM 15807 TaxID=1123380 RepID=A0A1M5TX63_9BACT|nr:ABC transporter permease subunit [Thermosipho atlanticus]SHH55196.1 carbohydrate ABC transporter membrane protein 2, CUT1 family [Thermosipho atlanticus DSM 15807]
MVVKRRNFLTHFILIVLIILILFPIVWVVSTSLRRDNAAFSTKLFSSRLSIQNYKDLLFPEQNVLRLLKDIESITTNSSPYTEKTYDALIAKFNKDIERLKNYSIETRSLIEKSDEKYEAIQQFIMDNSDELVSNLVNNAKLMKEKSKETVPQERELYIAINVLLKESKVKERDIKKYFDMNKVESYYKEWESLYSDLINNIEKKKESIKSLEAQINSLKKSLDVYQREYTRISGIIKESIFPRFLSFEDTLIVALDILNNFDNSVKALVTETNEMEEFEKIRNYLQELATLKFTDEFSEFSKKIQKLNNLADEILEKWKNYPGKSTSRYADFLSTIRLFNLKASKQLKESVGLLVNFSGIVDKYVELSNLLESVNMELVKSKSELSELTAEYDSKLKELQPAEKYVFSVILSDKIDSFINKVKKYKLPKDINKAYLAIRILRTNLNNYLSYVDDDTERKELRSYLRSMDWVETYKNFKKRYETFSKDMKAFLDEFDKHVSNIEEIGPNAIRSAKNGLKIRISALAQLFPKIQSDYPARIGSNLSLSSKGSTDLIDLLPLKGANSELKIIDQSLFRIDQIWKEKTEHHLIRWIINSVIVAGLVAIITTLVNALAAYPFSRMRFRGRRYGIMSLLLIQMFPAIMYMVALYGFLSFLGRYIPVLGLNTLGGLIFVYLGGIAFNMYLIKGFYDTIPSSLEEAAMIDGATRWQTFWRIVLPLASPILAVVVILSFMGTFNEFVLARIILQDVEKYTYAVGLWTFSTGPYETEWGLFSAAALIGMAPMVILFLSMQKYLVGGLTKGSVKG